MIKRIGDPKPERCAGEEDVLLAEHIELGIPIQDSGRNELVENSDNERRKDSEQNIVEGKGPGLVCNLTREIIEERKLYKW